MTIRTFWSIFLKMIGLFMIPKILNVFTLLQVSLPSYSGNEVDFVNILMISTIALGSYVAVLYLLIFKTKWFIDTLHLEKGFTEHHIDFTISSTVVLKIATIVIGGLYASDSFPWLCTDLTVLIKKDYFRDSPKSIANALQFIVGIILIAFSTSIVNFINHKANE